MGQHGTGIAGNHALVSPANFLAFLEGDDRSPRAAATTLEVVVPRAAIRYRAVRGAIERRVVEARQNDSLGESVVVRFAVDPVPHGLTALRARSPSDWQFLVVMAAGTPLCLALAGLVPVAISERPKQRFRDRTRLARCPRPSRSRRTLESRRRQSWPGNSPVGLVACNSGSFRLAEYGRGRGNHPVVTLAHRITGSDGWRPLARHRRRWHCTDDPGAGRPKRSSDNPDASSGSRNCCQSCGHGLGRTHPRPAKRF